jgi:hypothetical protein
LTAGDVIERVTTALESAGISCMLTGSFASSYHGAPRATQDIDLVIDATAEQIRTFISLLRREEFYADEGAALEAVRNEGQFNLIDLAAGWKVDLMIRKSRPFSREEFGRRAPGEVEGVELPIATPEDLLIAAKLLRIRSSEVDQDYVERWVRELDLAIQWLAVKRAAGID